MPFWVDCSTTDSIYYNKTYTSYLTSSWRHIAVTRDINGIIRCFLDGILQVSLNRNGCTYSSNKVVINNSYYYSNEERRGYGYMDDLCLISGTALWTENFTPPTEYLEMFLQRKNPKLYENNNIVYN